MLSTCGASWRYGRIEGCGGSRVSGKQLRPLQLGVGGWRRSRGSTAVALDQDDVIRVYLIESVHKVVLQKSILEQIHLYISIDKGHVDIFVQKLTSCQTTL